MYNTKKSIKVYVPVEVSFDEKGRMYPRRIHWEDGQATTLTAFGTCVRPMLPAQADRATGIRFARTITRRTFSLNII